jgi:protein O-mannosyl-transferase
MAGMSKGKGRRHGKPLAAGAAKDSTSASRDARSQGGEPRGRQAVWAGLLAMVLAFALYAPTIGYDFVTLDDPLYVETSQVVKDGFSWEGVRLAFTTAPENYWAPLLWMSFMFDMELSGGPAWSCHLTNTILFSLNVGLIFLLVRRWTKSTGVALATVLLWAFHPTRVESVAWVTARKDVLSGVFFFLGLWFYTIARERRPHSASAATGEPRDGVVPAPPTTNHQRSTLILLSWLCMLLGGMAKQIVILMPAAFLLLDVWPLGRTEWDRVWKDGWRLAGEKWAFWILAVIYAALPIVFHVETKAVMDVPAWHRALMIPVHYLFYLGKVLWPTRLMPLQPDLPSWWELLMGAAVVLAGLTWAAWRWRRRFPLALWGWLWFAVLLFPLSGVVWAGAERVATRWLYIPQIGLMLAAAALVTDQIRSRGWSRRWVSAGCALVLAIWGGMSLDLSRHWRGKDHFGIWAYTCNPGHAVACMLGGDGYLFRKDWVGASEAYEMGSALWNTHCFLRLAIIWNSSGRTDLTDDAWPRFEKGLGKSLLEAVEDEGPMEKIFLWRIRGQCMQARGDLDGAIGAFKEAMALEEDPEAFVVVEYLRACHEAGKFDDEAAAVAERMTKAAGEDRRTWKSLFPSYAQIWRDNARGYAYGYFLEYAKRHPEDAVAFNNMAWLLATAKPVEILHARMEEWPAKAVEWAARAVDLEEGKKAATAWDTLGAARANAGDFAGAIAAATKGAALAREGGGMELARKIEMHLAEYRAGRPWRE